MDNVLVIGISGATNAGKSSLANYIQQSFDNVVICKQDDYIKLEDPEVCFRCGVRFMSTKFCMKQSSEDQVAPETIPLYHDWENVKMHDMDKCCNDLNTIINNLNNKQKTVVIIEGFLVYSDHRLSSLCHLKLFLDIDSTTCKLRRATRNYQPCDPRGYFENCVWPSYLNYRKAIAEVLKDAIFLNGNSNFEVIQQKVFNLIN